MALALFVACRGSRTNAGFDATFGQKTDGQPNTPLDAEGAPVSDGGEHPDVAPELIADATANSGDSMGDGGNGCDVNLTTETFPDGPIGDGGATVGGCVSCARSSCQAELSTCNADCLCAAAVVAVLDCVQTDLKFGECWAAHLTTANQMRVAICISHHCLPECSNR
jgi:hypothetical protein